MSAKVDNVLFVCSHSSARSIMAEGLLNGIGGGNKDSESNAPYVWSGAA